MTDINPAVLDRLSAMAWAARPNAHLHGKTAVGCAVLDSNGGFHAGCNVEHRYRCHDIHAETNTLSTMVAAGSGRAVVVLIAAERDHFTPCGSCLDWIFELGGPDCVVVAERLPGTGRSAFTAADLMPQYPR